MMGLGKTYSNTSMFCKRNGIHPILDMNSQDDVRTHWDDGSEGMKIGKACAPIVRTGSDRSGF